MMNNFRKVIAVVIAFTMISGALLVVIPSAGQSAEADTLGYPEQIAMYAEPEFRERKATDLASGLVMKEKSAEGLLADNIALNTTMPFVTSGTFWDDTSSVYPGSNEAVWFDAYDLISITKRGEGEHCEVWVADDLSFYNGTSDPRDSMKDILDWQVDYIMDEFDNNIYPVMNETFIEAPALNGSNPDIWYWQYIFGDDTLTEDNITDMLFPTNDTGKMMIVVFNMIDENWYDGYINNNHRAYTAGYYWSLIRAMYDRNVMHIDCYDWLNRIGDNVSRPYLYESTIAHEYQHLLHDEMDGAEESWVNEGLSMMAEFLCGYGISYDHISEFIWYPDNSLTVWGDQNWMGPSQILADYGAVALFDLYLYDHFGGTEMLQAIFTSQMQGIEGVNEAFLNMGYNRLSFDRVYRDWRLANLFTFNMMETENPLYTYDPDLITIFDIDHYIWGMEVPAGYNFDRYEDNWYPYYLQAYGTDYFAISLFYDYTVERMSSYSDMMYSKFVFDGDDSIRTGWQYAANEPAGATLAPSEYWYSGSGIDETDLLLTQEVDLTVPTEDGKHTLTMSSYWDIEEQWDFGFVQVSTDGGETWTSLDDTTDYCRSDIVEGGYPEIEANMPGLTGSSEGVVDVVFDLSAYDGQEILVGYRYMTDWGYTAEGWYIFDVNVDGADVALDTLINPPTPEADFMVTIVIPTEDGWMVIDIPSLDDTEVAQKLLASISSAEVMFLLVSSNNGPVNYEFTVTERGTFMVG
jgi:immune inhibitor A